MLGSKTLRRFLCFSVFFLIASHLECVSPFIFETGDPLSTKYLSEIISLLKMQQDLQYVIQPTDFSNKQLVISSPGTYTFQKSIIFQDTLGFDCAIKIDSSNVTIDLNDQYFTTGNYADNELSPVCCRSRTASSSCGIIITAGKRNITIKNGTISGFPGFGIKAAGTSSNTVQNVKIDDVFINNNSSGISFAHTIDASIEKSTMNRNCGTSTTYGAFIDTCTSVYINQTQSNSNCSDANAYGFFIQSSKEVKLQNCLANTNDADGESSGFFGSQSEGIQILNSQANNNKSDSSSNGSIGICLQSSIDCQVKGNKAIGNEAPSSNSYGILLDGSNYCSVEENRVDQQTYGIIDTKTDSSTSLFMRNVAFRNTNNYSVSFATESLIVKTTAINDFSGLTSMGEQDNISLTQ